MPCSYAEPDILIAGHHTSHALSGTLSNIIDCWFNDSNAGNCTEVKQNICQAVGWAIAIAIGLSINFGGGAWTAAR